MFGGEADDGLLVGSGTGEAGEYVLGWLQVEIEGVLALQLARRGFGSPEVRWRGGHQQDMGLGELRSGRVGELVDGLDVHAAHAGRLEEAYVGGDQGDVGAAPRRGGGQSEAHAA